METKTPLDRFYTDKRCAVCGKTFTVPHPTRWGYKKATGKQNGGYSYRYFCSWKCLRADENNKDGREKKKMEKETAKKRTGRPPKKAAVEVTDRLPEEAQTVELVYDPSIKEEYERDLAAREARGRMIAAELDRAAAVREEMINGARPLPVAAVYSRTIEGARFKKMDGGMMLVTAEYCIRMTAYEWFKLTEEILVAIRQLDATRPAEEE